MRATGAFGGTLMPKPRPTVSFTDHLEATRPISTATALGHVGIWPPTRDARSARGSRMAYGKADHHRGSYQTQAKRVRDRANADPTTRCWQCGKTKAEHGRAWTAGHINDGQVGGPLAPECERCNYSRGATAGNRKRQGLTTTQDW